MGCALVVPVLQPEDEFAEFAALGVELRIPKGIVSQELAGEGVLTFEDIAISPRSRELHPIDLDHRHLCRILRRR